jgi:hypothetical protein
MTTNRLIVEFYYLSGGSSGPEGHDYCLCADIGAVCAGIGRKVVIASKSQVSHRHGFYCPGNTW